MRTIVFIAGMLLVIGAGGAVWAARELDTGRSVFFVPPKRHLWNFQSVDTMKYSRDMAREKLQDAAFDTVIERQVGAIADIGATHVAIATPYDAEFLPFLERWVAAARRHGLSVWFRGNWSGWEEWFGYPGISRAEHLAKTESFILAHPDLFRDGDAFTSCPECENGGPGDPRVTQDIAGYRQFLIDERRAMEGAFAKIGKRVRTDLFSMNGDVAKLIMDKATTKALGGVVTVDHYVKTPEQLVRDVEALAKASGGRIILGEFGAPIPDIHGAFSEAEQARWIREALAKLEASKVVEGVSYWLSVGGSTEIWDASGEPRQAVAVLQHYFAPSVLFGFVRDELGRPIVGATVTLGDRRAVTDIFGRYTLYYHLDAPGPVVAEAPGFLEETGPVTRAFEEHVIVMTKAEKDWPFLILRWVKNTFAAE